MFAEDSLAFTVNALDRMAPRRTDAGWLAQQMDLPQARHLGFIGERALLVLNPLGGLALYSLPPSLVREPVFLGSEGEEKPIFASLLPDDQDLAMFGEEVKAIDLRSLAMQSVLPPPMLGVLAQARTLLHWHSTHRFCSRCGAPSEMRDGGYRRHCPACAADHFPRTDPVSIMLVTMGDRCLLGRQARFAPGMYSALAGFIEPGETIEEAARREVFEEAGIRVGEVRYHSSQPWPFPANLMIGVLAEGLSETITIDRTELEDARWFTREEVRAMLAGRHPAGLIVPAPFAIANRLLRSFIGA
ncbi:NAD(+) diphosphatase [Rhodoligotrophos defluvii]|uniref:NAD(+) diphosphatase n=1 Tax=Rhodoligotrophos defluvii TaxID=2561934 RepID=UPI0010C98A4E|nr:NAD(+) diphosphatase [Rhodoligotrophos defluvii]